jgi:hypothetical protein
MPVGAHQIPGLMIGLIYSSTRPKVDRSCTKVRRYSHKRRKPDLSPPGSSNSASSRPSEGAKDQQRFTLTNQQRGVQTPSQGITDTPGQTLSKSTCSLVQLWLIWTNQLHLKRENECRSQASAHVSSHYLLRTPLRSFAGRHAGILAMSKTHDRGWVRVKDASGPQHWQVW